MLILTSSAYVVAKDFARFLPKPAAQLRGTFVPTAAEVSKGNLNWLNADRQALADIGLHMTDFSLVDKTAEEVKEMLQNTDFLFISGGNTFYLLQELQKSGAIPLIQKYVAEGGIYCGSSAGSVVAGPDISLTKNIEHPDLAPELKGTKALSLTELLVFPHWGSDYFAHHYQKIGEWGYQKATQMVLLTDNQYLVITEEGANLESI